MHFEKSKAGNLAHLAPAGSFYLVVRAIGRKPVISFASFIVILLSRSWVHSIWVSEPLVYSSIIPFNV
jgi:hypothetical protein